MFRTVPLSIIERFSLYTSMVYVIPVCWQLASRMRTDVLILLASCMTYTIAVCTVKRAWWWTEELSETCRVLFQKQIWVISASMWYYYKKIECVSTVYVVLWMIMSFSAYFLRVRSSGLSRFIKKLWNFESYRSLVILILPWRMNNLCCRTLLSW